MTWLECAQKVVDTQAATMHDGTLLDHFTASHLVAVNNALQNPANRERFAAMPLQAAVTLAFRLTERTKETP